MLHNIGDAFRWWQRRMLSYHRCNRLRAAPAPSWRFVLKVVVTAKTYLFGCAHRISITSIFPRRHTQNRGAPRNHNNFQPIATIRPVISNFAPTSTQCRCLVQQSPPSVAQVIVVAVVGSLLRYCSSRGNRQVTTLQCLKAFHYFVGAIIFSLLTEAA